MQHQAPPQAQILQIVAGYWLSRAVYLAARLKLADAVADGPATLLAIATATGTRIDRLRRLMRALTAHGFFHDAGDGTFRQTVGSAAFGPGGQHASDCRGGTRA
jgi:DNA-binding IclR family transcriptional regulator